MILVLLNSTTGMFIIQGRIVFPYQTINIIKALNLRLGRKQMPFYLGVVLNESSEQFMLVARNWNRLKQVVYPWIVLSKGGAIRHPIKWDTSIVQVKIRQSAALLVPVLPFNDAVVHLMEQVKVIVYLMESRSQIVMV